MGTQNVIGLLMAPWVFVAALTGCNTPNHPGSNSTASIAVPNVMPSDVLPLVEEVFTEAGYNTVKTLPDSRVFERLGGRMDALKYGDWDGKGVMIRATVRAEIWGANCLVLCEVVAVRDFDRPSLEVTTRVSRGYRKQYQDLLDAVQRRFLKW